MKKTLVNFRAVPLSTKLGILLVLPLLLSAAWVLPIVWGLFKAFDFAEEQGWWRG